MAGLDLNRYAEGAAIDWAVPDIVVAFSVPHEHTLFLPENIPNPFLIFGH